jgi:hypothetical protein
MERVSKYSYVVGWSPGVTYICTYVHMYVFCQDDLWFGVCKMFVVFYSVHLYMCVFMTCTTSDCLSFTLMDLCNVCVYVRTCLLCRYQCFWSNLRHFQWTYLPWCYNLDCNCKNFIKTNFHGFNQHGGVLVSELQAPLIMFRNMKIRMWGRWGILTNLKRGKLLAAINTDAPSLTPLIYDHTITTMLHAVRPTNGQWNAHAYELLLCLGLHFCFCQFSFMLHTVLIWVCNLHL